MSKSAEEPAMENQVEDVHSQPSTSTSDIEVSERERSKQSCKEKKSNQKSRWSVITNIFKKSTSPSHTKKLKSKSLSTNSLSLSKDSKSISSKDCKLLPDDDTALIPDKDTLTSDNDKVTTDNDKVTLDNGKVTSDEYKVTLDNDNETPKNDANQIPDNKNESTPVKANKTTSDGDKESKRDKDIDSTSSNVNKALKDDDTSPETGEGTTPLLEEDSTLEIEEYFESIKRNSSNSAINNDSKPSSDGDTKLITGDDRPNNNELINESYVTPLSDLSFDGVMNNPEENHDHSVEDAHVTADHLAATEDQTEDLAKLTSEDHEYEKILEEKIILLREFIEMEKAYIEDLCLVVDGIMVAMSDPEAIGCDISIPEDLTRSEKDKLIFNNIKKIYEWHRDVFLPEVEKCLHRPYELGKLFKKYEHEFEMYIDYCQKITTAECILLKHDKYFEELRKFLDHTLNFSHLLFKPMQILMHYKQLLLDILKYSDQLNLKDEAEALREAIKVVGNVFKRIDDNIAVNRLIKFQGNFADQGKLLFQGKLACSEQSRSGDHENGPKRYLQVFLFEKVIIFSEEKNNNKHTDDFSGPVFVCKAQIQVNKMILEEQPDSPNGSFVVKSVDGTDKPLVAFTCRVNDDQIRSNWLRTIKDLLQRTRRDVAHDAPKKPSSDTQEEPAEGVADSDHHR